ncbi:MAG: D-arabinono-1,4-lactone oxidase [Actinomycetota bacterium]
MSWSNWTGDQTCYPDVLATPSGVDELSDLLHRATERELEVRVAGAGHAFSDAVLTDGMLISLDRMDRVLEVDAAARRVTVQAGIRLRALNEVLDAHGLALENLGDIDAQSIAGATATGTHGTGGRFANLSSNIVSLELMSADGSVVELSEAKDPDAWRAARVSIGALGVITVLTLRVVPAFTLRARDEPRRLEDVLDNIEALVADNDHFEFFVFPHSRLVQTRTNKHVHETPQPRSPVKEWLDDEFLPNVVFGGVQRLGRRMPRMIPLIDRVAARAWGTSTRVDRSHRIFVSPRRVRFTEMEYAIPREHATGAIEAVKLIAERPELKVSFPIEVRFVAPDDAFLSPAAGRDTCYIAVHMFERTDWRTYFSEVEAIMGSLGGRPHWGKRHSQTAATLATRYPEWERFVAVRDRLDPARRFTNAYIARTLGP